MFTCHSDNEWLVQLTIPSLQQSFRKMNLLAQLHLQYRPATQEKVLAQQHKFTTADIPLSALNILPKVWMYVLSQEQKPVIPSLSHLHGDYLHLYQLNKVKMLHHFVLQVCIISMLPRGSYIVQYLNTLVFIQYGTLYECRNVFSRFRRMSENIPCNNKSSSKLWCQQVYR